MNDYILQPDSGKGIYIRPIERQGEVESVIDYNDPWETRRIYTDEWGEQTVINHDMGQ